MITKLILILGLLLTPLWGFAQSTLDPDFDKNMCIVHCDPNASNIYLAYNTCLKPCPPKEQLDVFKGDPAEPLSGKRCKKFTAFMPLSIEIVQLAVLNCEEVELKGTKADRPHMLLDSRTIWQNEAKGDG